METTRLDAPAWAELWLVHAPAEPAADRLALLSAPERERASRLRDAGARWRYQAAHAALRILLAQRTGLAEAALDFEQGAHGKPRLAGGGPCFSLSHAGHHALIALARDDRAAGHEIGVDAVPLQSLPDLPHLVRRYCTAAEAAALARLPQAQAETGFLRCWARKEAVLKALGTGLGVDPQGIDAGAANEARVLRVDAAAGRPHVELAAVPDAGPALLLALARLA